MRQHQILAGAVREIGDGLCGALLLSLRHLSTEPRLRGSPLAAGLITANRVACTNIVCAIPVQVACRHFDVVFWCFVFGSVSLAFQ